MADVDRKFVFVDRKIDDSDRKNDDVIKETEDSDNEVNDTDSLVVETDRKCLEVSGDSDSIIVDTDIDDTDSIISLNSLNDDTDRKIVNVDREVDDDIDIICDPTATVDNIVISDELIERNFKTFRSYIETCVKVTDLIVFYDLFTAEQTKKFRQLYKSDPTAATSMAFDEVLLMDNQPDKYNRLLIAMKDAGYPKIERILKGELLPMGSDHRQTIRRSFKDIYQNLIPREILPYLLANDVITHDDYEEVKAAEKNYSTGSAAIELLTVLPNRHTDWYKHFIKALVSGSHKDLAKTIDKDLATRIIEEHADPFVQTSCLPRSIAYPFEVLAGTMHPTILRHCDQEENADVNYIKSGAVLLFQDGDLHENNCPTSGDCSTVTSGSLYCTTLSYAFYVTVSMVMTSLWYCAMVPL